LNVANALWAEKSYPFKEDYFAKISKFYKTGGVFPVDFKGDSEKVRLQISSWVEDMTKERIKNLLPSGTVDDLTHLVLVNAIYFKGDWSVPFKVDRTKDLDFTLADGKKVKKPMMNANNLEVAKFAAFNEDGSYFKTPMKIQRGAAKGRTSPVGDGFAMLELPYKGNELSMLVIAPSNAKKLAAVESKMTAKNLSAWLAKLQQRKVHVFMPKFKIEAEYTMGDADAPGTLQKMGMTRAFVNPRSPDGAVFDGMSHAKSPTEKLYITKVLHKSFIEVNEKGTEAAAATAVVMAMPASAPISVSFTPTFKADRPFLYLIRDRATGSILFMGRMMNPEN
jgi:serpin B